MNRSKDFRCTYGKIHEIRALVPKHVPFMACTATVTKSVRDEVISLLDMKGCEVISTSPDRPNIFYSVQPRTDIELDLLLLIDSLKQNKNNASRVIVYCPSLNAQIYMQLSIMSLDKTLIIHLVLNRIVTIVCLACTILTLLNITKM